MSLDFFICFLAGSCSCICICVCVSIFLCLHNVILLQYTIYLPTLAEVATIFFDIKRLRRNVTVVCIKYKAFQ